MKKIIVLVSAPGWGKCLMLRVENGNLVCKVVPSASQN